MADLSRILVSGQVVGKDAVKSGSLREQSGLQAPSPLQKM